MFSVWMVSVMGAFSCRFVDEMLRENPTLKNYSYWQQLWICGLDMCLFFAVYLI